MSITKLPRRCLVKTVYPLFGLSVLHSTPPAPMPPTPNGCYPREKSKDSLGPILHQKDRFYRISQKHLMQDRSTRYQDILLTNWVKNHRLKKPKHHLRAPVTSNGHGQCVSGSEKPPPHSSKEREAHQHSERQNPRKSPA